MPYMIGNAIDLAVTSTSLKHHWLVKAVAGYVVVSFIIMEILWFFWCRPFHHYWKVPAPNCTSTTYHCEDELQYGPQLTQVCS